MGDADTVQTGEKHQEDKGQVLDFFSIHTGERVTFRAFLTDFQDQFQSEWNSEDVYGRMDPIQTFKGTKRTISLAWDCVAGSKKQAKENMDKCSELFKMLYPTYEGTTMKASPMMKLKFANLITDTKVSDEKQATAEAAGLTGTIDGFAYSPDLEQGFFEEGGSVFPQTITLECTFIVMHTHDLGYDTGGGSRFPTQFPYNRGKVTSDATTTNTANATPDPTSPPGTAGNRQAVAVRTLQPNATGATN